MTHGEMLDLVARMAAEDRRFRQRLLADSRAAIEERFGIGLPADLEIRVLQDTAEAVHVVLPHPDLPAGELSDADLEAVAGGRFFVKESGSLDVAG